MPVIDSVVVVGAGLAGLRAAQVLEAHDVDVTVIDRSEVVGGRQSSRVVDGFTVDEGFQLINPAYPELRATGALADLSLRAFPSAVVVRNGGRMVSFSDPREDPIGALRTVRNGLVPLRELLPMARLLARLGWSSELRLSEPDTTTIAGLRAAGISERAVAHLLRPFLAGVLLDEELETSWHYTQYALRSFVRCRPSLPVGGVAALPHALRRQLRRTQFRLGETVTAVSPTSVTTSLATERASAVIVATDATSAHELTNGPTPAWRSVTTWWCATPVLTDGRLRVDGDDRRFLNAVAISAVVPEHAPSSRGLVALSALDGERVSEADVRAEVAGLYDLSVGDVSIVTVTNVPHALPRRTAPLTLPARYGEVVTAGDYLETPSIQGALVSGRRAAHEVLRRLSS